MSSISDRWNHPRVLAIGVAVMLFGLIACGSTVQDRSQLAQRAGNTPVDEFGNPIPGATSTTGGTFVPGQPGSSIGGGGGGFIPGTGSGTASGRNGPGVTSTSVAIGLSYCDDQQAVARSLGFNPAPSDERRAWEIILEDTNKKGGINGRKVVPVWNQLKCSSSTQSASQLYESSCQHFTRDHKVFAVMGAQEDVPNYIACVTRAGAVIIDTNVTDSDKQFLRQYPTNIQPSSLAVDSVARLEVDELKRLGYFKRVDPNFPNVKVGILVDDTPGFERTLNNALLPALKSAGYSVSSDNIARIPHVQRNSDLATLTAAISAAVLRFSGDRVSHVLFLQARGTLTLFFLREAETQRYYPRYGFNSADAPQYILDYSGGGVVNPRNMVNSLGIGWNPGLDVPRGQGPTTPERLACLNLLKSHGYDALGDANAEAIALGVCDGMSFLALSLRGAGSVINQSTFLASVNGLGNNRWRATGALGYSLLLPSKHDGNNHYRTFAYDPAKQYFRYTSGNISIGY